MSVVVTLTRRLECDGCGREIKRDASTVVSTVATFLEIDEQDTPLFDSRSTAKLYHHIWCIGGTSK